MIIIEGIDGVGKSTVCAELIKIGYTIYNMMKKMKRGL